MLLVYCSKKIGLDRYIVLVCIGVSNGVIIGVVLVILLLIIVAGVIIYVIIRRKR